MSKKLFKSIEIDPAWRPWFTSDLHLFHANAAKHRDFPSADAMRVAMTIDWNIWVREKDLVFILGDVALATSKQTDELIEALNLLKGRKWLIPGNHDARMDPRVVDACFERVLPPIQDIKGEHPDHGKFRMTLSHFPLASWNRAHYGAIHLHGHSHGNLNYDRLFGPRHPKMMDVGIDTNHDAWAPYSLNQVLGIMSARRHVQVDHHANKEEQLA